MLACVSVLVLVLVLRLRLFSVFVSGRVYEYVCVPWSKPNRVPNSCCSLLERTGFGYADANASWSSVRGQLVVVIDAPIKLLAVVTAVSVPVLVSALVSALALHLRALGLM